MQTLDPQTESVYVDYSDPAVVREIPARPLSTRLLRWIERRYLQWEFGALQRGQLANDDAWWIDLGDNAVRPCTFPEILDALLDGFSPAAIVPASAASQKPVPWRIVQYSAWWSNSIISKVWSIGFWAICLVVGWFLLCLATPLNAQGPAQFAYVLGVAGVITIRRRRAARMKRAACLVEEPKGFAAAGGFAAPVWR